MLVKQAKTILYVEDEQNIQQELAEVLEMFCENLHLASDGKQGVELYQLYQPDIVISDIRMPTMDGIEMVKGIKKINPKARVIFTTAFSDVNYFVEAIDLQVDGYILKPINLEHLEHKIIDIIDQDRVAEKLKQKQKMEAIGQLAGGIAHDFNNLLTIILGNLDLLEMQVNTLPTVMKHVDKTMKAAEKAADLTQKMLAVSRQKSMRLEETDLGDFFAETVDMLNHTIKGKISLHVSIEDNLPKIMIDTNELTNALINLVVNAKDALNDEGQIHLSANATSLSREYIQTVAESIEPGDYLEIAVTDNGVGIPHEIIDRILEPFFTTKDPGKGTGLGLSMIYGFVKQSNGHMRIYSEPGRGTKVHMFFPIRVESTGSGKTLGTDCSVMDSSALKDMNVLVVDDEEDIAEIAAFYLSTAGANTKMLLSADQALQELQNATYDLIVSDVVMPGENDGIDLATFVKAHFPNTVMVLSSGFSKEIFSSKGHDLNDVPMLMKPYNKEVFMEKICQAIQAKQA